MKRLLLAIAVFASLALQETTLPADHYCLAGPPVKGDTRGHECHCQMVCTVGDDGTITDHESTDCKLYCRRDKCLCHADEDRCHSPKG